MKTILPTQFDRMPVFDPRQVIDELPSINRFESETGPLHSNLRIRRVPRECDVWRTCRVIKDAALICAPKAIRPIKTGRKGAAAHEPAIPRRRRVINQIVANDVVE